MSVRVKRWSSNGVGQTEQGADTTIVQRETTVNGYTFHWGVNEVRNFLDDGVGAAHAAFAPGTTESEDIIAFGTSRS